jgi:putative ABC transport system substrate-binding protein
MRIVGVLTALAEDDQEVKARLAAFREELENLGWNDGRNIRIEYRWTAADPKRARVYAAESPLRHRLRRQRSEKPATCRSCSLRSPTLLARDWSRVSRALAAIPLALPISNTAEARNGSLKQIAPEVTRTAVIRDPSGVGRGAQFGAIQGAASSFGVKVSPVDARDAGRIEGAVTAVARSSNGSLILTTAERLCLTIPQTPRAFSTAARAFGSRARLADRAGGGVGGPTGSCFA